MIYVVQKLPKMYHQMSIEDFLFATEDTEFNSYVKNFNETATRTYEVEKVSHNFKRYNINYLISRLSLFNTQYADLIATDNKQDLYHSFKIPKKSGGLRQIDAPNEELKSALTILKGIFEEQFGALYHTSAFAYIKGRCTLDAVKKHQQNDSMWYGKYDLSNFFGNTNPDYVIKMLGMIYPFNEVIANPQGNAELRKSLSLAFLNGGLPQGTPLSPLITNLIMIPVDYKLTNMLSDFGKQKFIYTRYADDFIISSRYNFNFRKIEDTIVSVLAEFGAPFSINSKKTRYGSRAGRNWNLGIMLTADNQITIGNKKKRQFETMLFNYAMDAKNGVAWAKDDVQHMEGLRAYYRMIEGETIDRIVAHISQKTNVDIMSSIKSDLGRK